MHKRNEIKKKFVALLAGKTIAEDRVYRARFLPHDKDTLPALCISAGPESVETFDNLTYKRELDIIIQGIASSDNLDAGGADIEDVDDLLDAFANQIEPLLLEDPTIGGIADSMDIANSEIGVDEKDDDIRAILLTVHVVYYTPKTVDLDSNTVPFKTAGVSLKPAFSDVDGLPQS